MRAKVPKIFIWFGKKFSKLNLLAKIACNVKHCKTAVFTVFDITSKIL